MERLNSGNARWPNCSVVLFSAQACSGVKMKSTKATCATFLQILLVHRIFPLKDGFKSLTISTRRLQNQCLYSSFLSTNI